eukprot:gnl/MRDRNA2_/MRDRNA2_105399_c0_seq1.p1 gnl/MRDRNA2_/MRDRNA2_105399_c0~~gnl/MRDRNA2_/MRDRNA2_105399_c0_seq1.p1  ORF type:complete len:135 (-),score=12.64 gnl/MRDRNA2_/MRDRNA2_105399_c0_seq1:78-482(-)
MYVLLLFLLQLLTVHLAEVSAQESLEVNSTATQTVTCPPTFDSFCTGQGFCPPCACCIGTEGCKRCSNGSYTDSVCHDKIDKFPNDKVSRCNADSSHQQAHSPMWLVIGAPASIFLLVIAMMVKRYFIDKAKGE